MFLALLLSYVLQIVYAPSKHWQAKYWFFGMYLADRCQIALQKRSRYLSVQRSNQLKHITGLLPYVLYIALGFIAHASSYFWLHFGLAMVSVVYMPYRSTFYKSMFTRLWHYTMLPLLILLLPFAWVFLGVYFMAMYFIQKKEPSFLLETAVAYVQYAAEYLAALFLMIISGKTDEAWPILKNFKFNGEGDALYQILSVCASAPDQKNITDLLDKWLLLVAVLHFIKTFFS